MSGVGGRTIDEAKRNMSYGEYESWVTYINRYGSLNASLRNEMYFAQLSALVCDAAGAKKSDGSHFVANDFLIYLKKEGPDLYEQVEPDEGATPDQLFALFSAIKKGS